ncbi:MAG: hypothetical protein KGJ06_06985 [Pseudomonadota bacterium]|nr:hypothetical protein [Pseudomonadota bacterium]
MTFLSVYSQSPYGALEYAAVANPQSILPLGIAGGEIIGAAMMGLAITAGGILPAEENGATTLSIAPSIQLLPAGIASEEFMGAVHCIDISPVFSGRILNPDNENRSFQSDDVNRTIAPDSQSRLLETPAQNRILQLFQENRTL